MVNIYLHPCKHWVIQCQVHKSNELPNDLKLSLSEHNYIGWWLPHRGFALHVHHTLNHGYWRDGWQEGEKEEDVMQPIRQQVWTAVAPISSPYPSRTHGNNYCQCLFYSNCAVAAFTPDRGRGEKEFYSGIKTRLELDRFNEKLEKLLIAIIWGLSAMEIFFLSILFNIFMPIKSKSEKS